MNKNLPTEIWDMIEVERRKAFRLRVEEFERKFEYSVGWWFVWHRWYHGNEQKLFPLIKEHVINRIKWGTYPPRLCNGFEGFP
jgi:hypothetical protein